MIKPIKPEDIKFYIPEEVIKIFNDLIISSFNGTYSIVNQNDAAIAIATELDITKQEAFNNHYLDIEDLYSDNWNVEYNKQCIGDSFESYFKFEVKNG